MLALLSRSQSKIFFIHTKKRTAFVQQKKFLTSFYFFDSKLTVKKEPIDIKAIRQSLGFTQEDLARAMGLALSTVSKWEQGVTSPSRLAREKIERLLKKEGLKKK